MKKLLIFGGIVLILRTEKTRRDLHKLIGYFEKELEAVETLQRAVIGIAEEYNYILPIDAVVDLNDMRANAEWN